MEYIDLGLSVKWATCNVGADSPEDYGDYFAWGEVIPKNIYLNATYLPDKNFNKVFKLPTIDEFKELLNKCTWTWTTLNGVNGYNVEGPNGNSIFLPAAGVRVGSDADVVRYSGYYWSATENYSNYARCLYFYSGEAYMYDRNRNFGHSVRLVKNILKEK